MLTTIGARLRRTPRSRSRRLFTLPEPRRDSEQSDEAALFRYCYSTSNHHTLIPLATYVAHCRPAIDLSSRVHHGRTIRTIPYSFRRRTALGRRARAAGVGLLRYGDPFISGMTDITQTDDRGRSFAMWRYTPDYEGDPIADIFVRFDFVLEVDVESACKSSTKMGASVLRRSPQSGVAGTWHCHPFSRPCGSPTN